MTNQAWRNFVCSICNRKRPPSEKRESGWGRAGQITLPVCRRCFDDPEAGIRERQAKQTTPPRGRGVSDVR